MENRKLKARTSFKNHQATVILQNEQFFIVDWRNKNGSGEYAVRYILDVEKGNFVVTGDLGDSIASWFNKVTPDKLKIYIRDIGYYMSKFQCTSDDYTHDWEDVKADLYAIKEEILNDRDFFEDEVNEDFNEMERILDDLDTYRVGTYPEELTDLFEKYNTDWWESDFSRLGCRIAQRVILWAEGFQMACEQLNI